MLAQTLGASEQQIFRNFILPSAVPVNFNGLQLGLIFAERRWRRDHRNVALARPRRSSARASRPMACLAQFLLALLGMGSTWGMTALQHLAAALALTFALFVSFGSEQPRKSPPWYVSVRTRREPTAVCGEDAGGISEAILASDRKRTA